MVPHVDIARRMPVLLWVYDRLARVIVPGLIARDLRLSVSPSHGKRRRNRPVDNDLGFCSIRWFAQ